ASHGCPRMSASRSRTLTQTTPVCLVYEYCFLREDFDSTGRDLVGTRLHVDRCLPHLLYLHYPVVRLAHFRVGQDHNPVRQVLFKLHSPLHRRSHSPQLRCHQTGRAGLYEGVDKIQNRSPPLHHLWILEDQRGYRVNNNPLRINQFGMSLDPLDKAQDRKVLPTDRRPANLHLTSNMTRPRGNPPVKISSRPGIPVGVLSTIGIATVHTHIRALKQIFPTWYKSLRIQHPYSLS